MAEGVVKKKFLERENKGYLNWCGVTFASQEQKWFIMKPFSANKFAVKFLLRNSSFLILNIIIAFAQAILQIFLTISETYFLEAIKAFSSKTWNEKKINEGLTEWNNPIFA